MDMQLLACAQCAVVLNMDIRYRHGPLPPTQASCAENTIMAVNLGEKVAISSLRILSKICLRYVMLILMLILQFAVCPSFQYLAGC